MPKMTEAYLEARRQQIIDAASACFARKGFHRTTMEDICREAELSPGAVYRYFKGKEEIIESGGEENRQRNVDLIEAIEKRGDTVHVLEGLVDAFFSKLDEPEARDIICLDVEVWAEALRNPRVKELVSRGEDSHRKPFTEIVRRAQERGEIDPALDAEAVARVMLSFWSGLAIQKGLDPQVDVWRYVAVVMAMMTGSFWQGEKPEVEASDA
jgi:AcrR family transcriptional regulator